MPAQVPQPIEPTEPMAAAGTVESTPSTEPAPAAAPDPTGWCAPELPRLSSGMCYALPAGRGANATELVIFLHGVIARGTDWQWGPQRSAARAAAVHGLVALMPKGRRHLRTDDMADYYTWPTSMDAQVQAEPAMLQEWAEARQELETMLGRPFAKTYVFGFSNGAYYVASLAARARISVDGYAAFAGGAAFRFARRRGLAGPAGRAPIYVGYGTEDGPAVRDCTALKEALEHAHWPSRVVASKGVGHVMTDAQIASALVFLRAR